MLRLALVGFVVRLAIGVALACLAAGMLALIRNDDASFTEGLRVSVWLVGCILLLFAFAGHSPTMRAGTIDPLAASFFPKLRPRMAEEYSGTRVSSGALFVLTAFVLFGVGVLFG
ncbi:MAG: hypothetical protein H0T61_14000 [Actinobacteria bacterium]|nr:hypothetical protein [Actinomycetota bacterium]